MPHLTSVADLIMGQSPPSTTYNEVGKGLPFFQGKTDFGSRHPTPRLFCSAPVKTAQPKDILMSIRAPVGPTNVADRECCIGRGLAAIRPREIDGEFLLFNLRYVESSIASLGSGSTFHAINKTQLGAIEVNEPRFGRAEQRRIAEVLELLYRAIEQQQQLLALTAELKKALLQQLFTHGLQSEPQKQTELGPIPQSWDVVQLRNCADVQTGVAKGRQLNGDDTVTLPYLRVANVQSGFLDLSEMKMITIRRREKTRYLLHDGDVVLTEGGDFDKLGRGFIWKAQIPDCVHQNHIFAVRVNRSRLLPEFFAHLSQSPYGKAYFLSVAHKTTNLACINTTKLKEFPVLIPTLEEQAEIIEILSAVDANLQLTQRKHSALSNLFRTLLRELMTARIRVKDLDLAYFKVQEQTSWKPETES